ncbi:hypothetical protein KIW84_054962 [Lathyrus oleraceus]|uniref:Uncharacterized protein n=1 Tax=Pisum sativum TaxID=3888 RepID=A0A9D4WWU0_PEA|nr:hypothetical protein KIW84_054962 [Pisum sativum]
MLTVLSALLTALAWPTTFRSATDFIDSTWSVAIDRPDKAGILLSEVLLGGVQGNRPVTLIENPVELVERVVLLGAPIAIKYVNWEAARKMVVGRFINAYSRTDWMLGVAFRASLLSQGLAGIQNVDVTDHIEGHSSYLWTTQHTLEELELETYYPAYNNILPKEQTHPNFTVSFLSIRNITRIIIINQVQKAAMSILLERTSNKSQDTGSRSELPRAPKLASGPKASELKAKVEVEQHALRRLRMCLRDVCNRILTQ